MAVKFGWKARYIYFYILLLLLWLHFILHKLNIMHIFKKSVNNTKEKGNERKNSICNVVFGGISISA